MPEFPLNKYGALTIQAQERVFVAETAAFDLILEIIKDYSLAEQRILMHEINSGLYCRFAEYLLGEETKMKKKEKMLKQYKITNHKNEVEVIMEYSKEKVIKYLETRYVAKFVCNMESDLEFCFKPLHGEDNFPYNAFFIFVEEI